MLWNIVSACTYDSTPPGADKINDQMPVLMIDASGLTANARVSLQYTDIAGSTTLQTQAEKIDASGRLLYPLAMAHGTRAFTLKIVVDVDGDAIFGGGADKTYGPQAGSFSSDTETINLRLTAADFTP